MQQIVKTATVNELDPSPTLTSEGVQDQQFQHFPLPLNGKMITAHDPSLIGTNFRLLQNMRYTPTSKEGVSGMTKLSTAACTNPHIYKMFSFVKDSSLESHMLCWGVNTALTSSAIYTFDAEAPSSGAFDATPLWTDTQLQEFAYFSSAPDETVAYCNGDEVCLWGGDESKISAFLVLDTSISGGTPSSYKDITAMMISSDASVEDSFSFGSGIDAYAMLCLENETAITTDSSMYVANYSISSGAGASRSTAQYKFGAASCLFTNAANSYVEVATAAGGVSSAFSPTYNQDFEVDIQCRFTATGAQTADFCGTGYSSGGWKFGIEGSTLTFKSGSSAIYASWTPSSNSVWYHLAAIRSGGVITIYVDGLAKGSGTIIGALTATKKLRFGQDPDNTAYYDGYMDEARISVGTPRWTSNFTAPTSAYSTSAATYFLIGSIRYLSGVKFNMLSPTAGGGSVSAKVWNGRTWEALTVTDGTSGLSATGWVTWTHAPDTAAQRYIKGYNLYWYEFTLSSGGGVCYETKMAAPMQLIKDIWDGEERMIGSCVKYQSSQYTSQTTKVMEEDYDSSSTATYMNMGAMTSSEFILCGFADRSMAIQFRLADNYNSNTSVMSVYYYDGMNWVSVGTVNDGTSVGGKTLAQSGVVSWNPPVYNMEFRYSCLDEVQLYYYKIVCSATLSTNVYVDYISGVPAPTELSGYSYPTMAYDRLWLFSENQVLMSAVSTAQVFNGQDCYDLEIGDNKSIVAATSFYTVFGSSLLSIVLIFKQDELWSVVYMNDTWNKFMLSATVGCVAPDTLRVVNVPVGVLGNEAKTAAIWMDSSGVYISDGRAPLPVHYDIANYFDKRNDECITESEMQYSSAYFDKDRMEYHLLTYVTISATPVELVFSLKDMGWFMIERGSDNILNCGEMTKNHYGNNYIYGATDDGNVHLLESGTSFNGFPIEHIMHFGDFLLGSDPLYDTRIRRINSSAKAKNTTSEPVRIDYTTDTKNTIDATAYFSMYNTGRRITNSVVSVDGDAGQYHSLMLSVSTDNEEKGFEPTNLGLFYSVDREHSLTQPPSSFSGVFGILDE